MNRLRNLARRIEKAKGRKKRQLERDFDLTRRSTGKVVWVSSSRLPAMHMGQIAEAFRADPIDGTYKRPKE